MPPRNEMRIIQMILVYKNNIKVNKTFKNMGEDSNNKRETLQQILSNEKIIHSINKNCLDNLGTFALYRNRIFTRNGL